MLNHKHSSEVFEKLSQKRFLSFAMSLNHLGISSMNLRPASWSEWTSSEYFTLNDEILFSVIPAKAGIQTLFIFKKRTWIPAGVYPRRGRE